MFAVATTLQHRAARQAESFTGGRTRDAGRALAGVFARPLWLAGLVADVLGFAMHAYALTAGDRDTPTTRRRRAARRHQSRRWQSVPRCAAAR